MKKEFELMIKIANQIKNPTKWDESLFGIVKKMPSSHKGEIGELFIEKLCEQKNISCKRNEKSRDA